MKLVGIPTAILRDKKTDELTVQSCVISGDDKRSIQWEGRNRSVFPVMNNAKGGTVIPGYGQHVEEALRRTEGNTDAYSLALVGHTEYADERIRNLAMSIGQELDALFGDRLHVSLSIFGDGESAVRASGISTTPFSLEEAYDQYVNNLLARLDMDISRHERTRIQEQLLGDLMHPQDALIAYNLSGNFTEEEDMLGAYDVYKPYYENLLTEAKEGKPVAIRELEMEMRHAALRLFVGIARIPPAKKASSNFVLSTLPDILAELPFRATHDMRRIFALEVRRLFGIPGNICVKSMYSDPKSPYFGDLTVIGLADASDKITGEEPDMVHLNIPRATG